MWYTICNIPLSNAPSILTSLEHSTACSFPDRYQEHSSCTIKRDSKLSKSFEEVQTLYLPFPNRALGCPAPDQTIKMTSTPVPKHLNFITGNKNKLAEVQAILEGVIELRNQNVDLVEIQGTVEEVTLDKARRAAEAVRSSLVIFQLSYR